jgi:hypothetical protein
MSHRPGTPDRSWTQQVTNPFPGDGLASEIEPGGFQRAFFPHFAADLLIELEPRLKVS